MLVRTNLLCCASNKSVKFSISKNKNLPLFHRRGNRCVRFSDHEHLISFATISNMVQEDHSKIWYGASEIKGIKKNIKMHSDILMNQKLRNKGYLISPDKKMYLRGLELRFDAKRKMRRRIAIQAVLKTQQRLKMSTWSVKEHYIADISKKFSIGAKSQALLDGLADARNVNC